MSPLALAVPLGLAALSALASPARAAATIPELHPREQEEAK